MSKTTATTEYVQALVIECLVPIMIEHNKLKARVKELESIIRASGLEDNR